MQTYVLVHGAMGGAHGWYKVRPLLREAGHDVFTPSLTGLGERHHLGGPQTNLSTHIQDVLALVEHEDLDEIVLAGHSYAGMVITGAADLIPDKIAHLVYLDAQLPQDGQSLLDLTGSSAARYADGRIAIEGAMQPAPNVVDGWRVVPAAGLLPNLPSQLRVQFERGQPLATFEEKVRLTVPLEERRFSRSYVKAGQDPPGIPPGTGSFWDAANRVRDDSRWRYFQLPCGHSMHIEMPRALAGILLQVAEISAPAPVAQTRALGRESGGAAT
jgi:pimeloyl-ACP methyl ester carboxylesterase